MIKKLFIKERLSPRLDIKFFLQLADNYGYLPTADGLSRVFTELNLDIVTQKINERYRLNKLPVNTNVLTFIDSLADEGYLKYQDGIWGDDSGPHYGLTNKGYNYLQELKHPIRNWIVSKGNWFPLIIAIFNTIIGIMALFEISGGK